MNIPKENINMVTFKYNIGITLIVVVILGAFQTAFAGNENKRGTAGGLEVVLPVGARGTAMSGANISTTQGIEAIHWNPAGLSRMNGSGEVMFSNMNYIADIKLTYGAVALQSEEFGSIGLSIKNLDFGNIMETTEEFSEGTGNVFSPSFSVIGLTYSRSLTDRISVGATIKYVSEKILRTEASGVGFDAGVQYAFGVDNPLHGLRFAVILKNLGPSMQYDGADLERLVIPPNSSSTQNRALKFTSQSFELPSTLDLGISYDYKMGMDNRFTVHTVFQNNNFGSDMYTGGLEYAFNEQVFLRGGYVYSPSQSTEVSTATIFSYSAGAGVNLDLGGMVVGVDYAYRATEYFSGTNTLALTLQF